MLFKQQCSAKIQNTTVLSMTEAVVRRCSVKEVFLEISQNSQENTCVRVLFLIKKRLRYRCFPVNFAKFLITLFLMEHLWWMLPCFWRANFQMRLSYVVSLSFFISNRLISNFPSYGKLRSTFQGSTPFH